MTSAAKKYPCSESPQGVCEFLPVNRGGGLFGYFACRWCLGRVYET